VPQNKKWVRVLDSLAAVFCFVSSAITLYLLKIHPEGKLPIISNIVVYIYLISSFPLGYLLYRASGLKKYERMTIVLFILSSSISLLLTIMLVIIKI